MNRKKLIQRNPCIIWYRNAEDGGIVTCIKENDNYVVLRGFEAWLWHKLSRPRSVGNLKKLIKANKDCSRCCDELEQALDILIGKKILQSSGKGEGPKEVDANQKYITLYKSVMKELSTAKEFSGADDLHAYHRNSIRTVERHFDENEGTVSYTYRKPHVALGGLSYGAKLYHKLKELKEITHATAVVEVGGGLGHLARSFLEEHMRCKPGGSLPKYVCCDLTPAFLENQRRLNGRDAHYIQLNAETLPFKDCSLDIVIANENLADFSSVRLNKKRVLDFLDNTIDLNETDDDSTVRALRWLKFSSIDVNDAPSEFIFNIGAFEFINEIKRVLKKGGLAFIAEYGIVDSYPKAVNLPGHVEYEIKFQHMVRLIKALGMELKAFSLIDFFEYQNDVEVIDECSFKMLRHLLQENGIEFPLFAYTREMLEERYPSFVKRIENLRYSGVHEKSVLHNLDDFFVLLIKKDENQPIDNTFCI